MNKPEGVGGWRQSPHWPYGGRKFIGGFTVHLIQIGQQFWQEGRRQTARVGVSFNLNNTWIVVNPYAHRFYRGDCRKSATRLAMGWSYVINKKYWLISCINRRSTNRDSTEYLRVFKMKAIDGYAKNTAIVRGVLIYLVPRCLCYHTAAVTPWVGSGVFYQEIIYTVRF